MRTFVLDLSIAVLVHLVHDALEHVVGVLHGCDGPSACHGPSLSSSRSLTMINPPEPLLQAFEVQLARLVGLEARPQLLDAGIARVLRLPQAISDFANQLGHAHDEGGAGGISRREVDVRRFDVRGGDRGAVARGVVVVVVVVVVVDRAEEVKVRRRRLLSGLRRGHG